MLSQPQCGGDRRAAGVATHTPRAWQRKWVWVVSEPALGDLAPAMVASLRTERVPEAT